MSRAHQHDDVELNLSPHAVTYLIEGKTIAIDARSLAVFWAARPHQLLEESTDLSWVTVPLAMFLASDLPASFVGAVLGRRLTSYPMDAYGPALPLQVDQWTSELRSGPEFRKVTVALEIEATCRRIASSGTVDRDSSRVLGAERVTVMAEFISAQAHEDIRVKDVANHAHLHPQYAMALFRNQIGTTIVEYLLQCRVSLALRLLVADDLSVSDVAKLAGFQSQSQFYERFRRVTGTTPSVYRRVHHGRTAASR